MRFRTTVASFLAIWNIIGSNASSATETLCDAPVFLDAKENIFSNYTLHPTTLWRNQVLAAATALTDEQLKDRALIAAAQGTFLWINNPDDVSKIEISARDLPCNHALGIALAALPYKECLQNGAPPLNESWSYEELVIKPLVDVIKAHPTTPFVIIVEPNVIGAVVLNETNPLCQHVARFYRRSVPLALKSLDLPNVLLYLDAAHGGWFGWKEPQDWQKPAAREIVNTWKAAGQPRQFRGVAVNVASYNSWDLSPGENFPGENVDYDLKNPARSEKRYLEILRKRIGELAVTMPVNAIMDTSRSGIQGIRKHWLDWCNINGAGFGHKPSLNIADKNLDAFVWVKWGGISDGTSDRASEKFKDVCGQDDAFQPMPERGVFSQAYFEMLLREWKPR